MQAERSRLKVESDESTGKEKGERRTTGGYPLGLSLDLYPCAFVLLQTGRRAGSEA